MVPIFRAKAKWQGFFAGAQLNSPILLEFLGDILEQSAKDNSWIFCRAVSKNIKICNKF